MTNEQAIKVLNMIEAHGSLAIQAKEKAIQALQKLDEIERIINCDDPVAGELPFQIQEDVFKYKMICEVMKNE